MGSGDPKLFAGRGTHYMHGLEDVTFRDRGNCATFAWGDFTLKVKEDRSVDRSSCQARSLRCSTHADRPILGFPADIGNG